VEVFEVGPVGVAQLVAGVPGDLLGDGEAADRASTDEAGGEGVGGVEVALAVQPALSAVAGDAVRRGQVQAERRMKARSSTSTPMERP
jgi:hypothetical protein